ncbi:MAG: acetyltransferase [Kiritimatiellae bacterium]|nr:acetyltransferase [Kiritimatiellia bacterium]
MKNLVIIGAGGFGREMFAAAREAVGFGTEFTVAGFLDDNPKALDGFDSYPPVLASLADYVIKENDVFITALGSVGTRKKCVQAIEARGGRFISIVHRTATVGPNVEIGEGSFLAPNTTLTADVKVGRHSCVFHNSSIGHDSILGDFTHVYAQCAIGGAVVMEECSVVYPGSVVTPRRKIGERSVVGALSAVFTDVPAGVTVFGNPALPIKE